MFVDYFPALVFCPADFFDADTSAVGVILPVRVVDLDGNAHYCPHCHRGMDAKRLMHTFSMMVKFDNEKRVLYGGHCHECGQPHYRAVGGAPVRSNPSMGYSLRIMHFEFDESEN